MVTCGYSKLKIGNRVRSVLLTLISCSDFSLPPLQNTPLDISVRHRASHKLDDRRASRGEENRVVRNTQGRRQRAAQATRRGDASRSAEIGGRLDPGRCSRPSESQV